MLKQLLSVFLQSHCLVCNRTTSDALCEYCLDKLSSHQLRQNDRLKLFQKQAIFAWSAYDGQLKKAIALMKYSNQPEIGDTLGRLLGQAWRESNLIKSHLKVTVVPIPMHRKKLQERGFNQAEIIAKSFCQLTGYELNSQVLVRTRETKAMFNLNSLEERAKNLQGAFRVGHKLPRHPILLVDDIYTTGTTVKESVRILEQKKIKFIGVAAVAKAGKVVIRE